MRFMISRTTLGLTAGVILIASGALAMRFSPVGAMMMEAAARARLDAIDLSASAGLRLENLTVEGRNLTSRDDILAALDADRGSPILTLDVAKARDAIENLPWVKTAKIERHLPATLHITLQEREAYALWQQGTRYTLVDREGKVIVDIPEADQSLPLIVGPDAPKHAAQLFKALASHPELTPRVRAAVRVGGRRWNIYLDTYENGIAVRLPEENIEHSLERLAMLEHDHKILERDLDFIDLRLEDRLIVSVHRAPEPDKPAPAAAKKLPATGPRRNI